MNTLIRSSNRRASSSHFYYCHGHDTNNCYLRRDAIEELIKRGKLNRFIKDANWND